MRKIFSSLILLALLFSARPTMAHKEWVHQYIVKQSYLFLENQLGPIPILRDAVGLNYIGQGNNVFPFNTPYPIGVGAWREDIDDIVYGYTTAQSFPPQKNDFTPSITHFWQADKGDNDRINLVVSGSSGNTYENAWTKARVLLFCATADGPKQIKVKWHPSYTTSGVARTYGISYTSLPELYKGNFFLDFIAYSSNDVRQYNHQQMHDPNFDNGFPQAVALQILGRVAHLLGDMGVPAHTHNHLHPCRAGFPDKYENHLGNTFYSNNGSPSCDQYPGANGWEAYTWTAATAAQQGPLLQDMYCQGDDYQKMRFLFYTLNQISDFFPSGVDAEDGGIFGPGQGQSLQRGNASYYYPNNSHIENIYNQYQNIPPSTINIQNIGNATFNFGIRATATLFQWFAYNAGITNSITNQQISINKTNNLLCPGESVSFSVPLNVPKLGIYYPSPWSDYVSWNVTPTKATGNIVLSSNKSSVYSITTNPRSSGLATVTANFSRTDDCYAGLVLLKRDFWIGLPDPFIRYKENIYLYDEVCPGEYVGVRTDVSQPDLEGITSYYWTAEYNGSIFYTSRDQYIRFQVPRVYSQTINLRCIVTNACGQSEARMRLLTAGPNGITPNGEQLPCSTYATVSNQSASIEKSAVVNDVEDMQVYPNPSDTELTILLPAHKDSKSNSMYNVVGSNYILSDILGKTVASGTIKGNHMLLNTRSLAPGMYNLSCFYAGRILHKKIQITH